MSGRPVRPYKITKLVIICRRVQFSRWLVTSAATLPRGLPGRVLERPRPRQPCRNGQLYWRPLELIPLAIFVISRHFGLNGIRPEALKHSLARWRATMTKILLGGLLSMGPGLARVLDVSQLAVRHHWFKGYFPFYPTLSQCVKSR